MASLALAAWSAVVTGPEPAAAQSGPNEVTVYGLANYSGDHETWSVGTDLPRLTTVQRASGGTWNKRIVSVRVGTGARLVAFESADYKGKCLTLASGDQPDLHTVRTGLSGSQTWSTRIGSLRVVPTTSPLSCGDLTGLVAGADEVVFFDLANFGDPHLSVVGTTEIPKLSSRVRLNRGTWDNVISAIKVGVNVRVLAYEQSNFLGACIVFAGTAVGGASGTYPDLGGLNAGLSGTTTWKDRISSVRIVTNATATCANPGTGGSGGGTGTGGSGGSGGGTGTGGTTKPPAAVAMGDSFISGEGGRWQGNVANDPLSGTGGTDLGAGVYTDPAGSICHRSSSSEIQSSTLPGIQVRINLACSGATTADIRSAHQSTGGTVVATQLDQLRGELAVYDVQLIVLSIGGNDLKFAQIIKDCANTYVMHSRDYPMYCNRDKNLEVVGQISTAMANVRLTIQDIQQVMTAAGKAPGTYRFMLQSYPAPLPAGSDFRWAEASPIDPLIGIFGGPAAIALLGAASFPARLSPGRCPVWDADATWARNTLVPMIADNLRAVAIQTGVEFLDLRDLFNGHEVCANGTSRGASPTTSEWARFVSVFPTPIDQIAPSQGAQEESMHPNAYGQQAIGQCLTLVWAAAAGGRHACRGATGIAPSAVTLTTSVCQTPGPGQACVFADSSYGGDSVTWWTTTEIRDLTAVRRATSGTWSKQASSMLLGSGVRVLAFDQADFSGQCTVFTAGDVGGATGGRYQYLDAAGWDNRIVSLIVVPGASGVSCLDISGLTAGDDQAILFDTDSYGVDALRLTHHTEIRDLSSWHITASRSWSDRISSAKTGRNVRVLAFEDVDFGGQCLTLSGTGVGGGSGRYDRLSSMDAGLSSGNWDNRISSIKVVDGRLGVSCEFQAVGEPEASQAYLYENASFGGSSIGFSLGAQVGSLLRYGGATSWNDRISSIKVGADVRVLVFEHTNFGGRCRIMAGTNAGGMTGGHYDDLSYVDMGTNSDKWNDRISSIKVVGKTTTCPS